MPTVKPSSTVGRGSCDRSTIVKVGSPCRLTTIISCLQPRLVRWRSGLFLHSSRDIWEKSNVIQCLSMIYTCQWSSEVSSNNMLCSVELP